MSKPRSNLRMDHDLDGEELIDRVKQRHRPLTQAERIIERFGGPLRLAAAMAEHLKGEVTPHFTTIYRWTYPRAKRGTAGVIPPRMVPLIAQTARREGILLTDADWFPGSRCVCGDEHCARPDNTVKTDVGVNFDDSSSDTSHSTGDLSDQVTGATECRTPDDDGDPFS